MFERYANQHAMRRPNQTVEDAKKEMENFIAERNDVAQANNVGGDNPSQHSLYNFGQASHPIMDNTSPTHSPFQEYDNSNIFWCVIDPFACQLFQQELKRHMDGESTIFSSELNRAINDVRENYRKVYGDKALNKAVGIFSSAIFIFDKAPINGKSRPSGIKVNNLGTVTVYPDGRKKYKGPLKVIKL
jgi:hypothetical protein